MLKPHILISDPGLKAVETPDRLSLCSGFTPDDWQAGTGWLSSFADVERKCAVNGDATVVQIIREEGVSVEVRAWRAIPACHEIFFKLCGDGRVLITDHLRNALAELPLAEREISKAGLADHLIFRSVRGEETYCAGLQRVGPGSCVTIDLRTGETREREFDRLYNIAADHPTSVYVDGIDEAMEKVIAPARNKKSVVNLFSGGVDSTLVHTYLGADVPGLAGEAWNVRAYEKNYPDTAAELLNISLRTFDVAHAEYMPLLESSIDFSGQPPCLDQVVLFDKGYRQPGQIFVTSGVADVVFGMDGLKGGMARLGRRLAKMPVPSVLTKTVRAIPSGSAGRKLEYILRTADLFRHPPNHPLGYAGLMSTYTDMSAMERMFGRRHVIERLEARLSYAGKRMEFSAPEADRVGRHLELAHWTVLAMEDGAPQFRHLAHGLGKELICPFNTRPVMDSALRVPVAQRYIQGANAKYLLKDLLRRRLPAYPVDQKKGASLFGVEDFFRDGPLQDIWDRYALPDFIEWSEREAFIKNPTLLTWNVAVFAIWRDRVLRNPRLTVLPGVQRFGS